MIKIKIKDKHEYIVNNLKYKNYSNLEAIVLLDTAINVLRDDFKLSDNEIWELLKDYKNKYKEKESE